MSFSLKGDTVTHFVLMNNSITSEAKLKDLQMFSAQLDEGDIGGSKVIDLYHLDDSRSIQSMQKRYSNITISPSVIKNDIV